MSLAVLGLWLGGCGGSGDTVTDATPDEALAGTAGVLPAEGSDGNAFARVDRDLVLSTDFVANYRRKFPDLAGDRSDNGIANDGRRICDYLVEFGRDPSARDVVLRRFATAIAGDGVMPDTATTLRVMRMGVRDICPDRSELFQQLSKG